MSHPLETIRHSCAHVMAAAIAELWPGAQFGVGPATTNGFYYDVLTAEPIGEDDLKRIAKQMRRIQKQRLPFERVALPIDVAIDHYRDREQPFKVELLELLRDKGSTAVAAETGDALAADDAAAGVPAR